ncbi:NAD+ synthase [bacterium]|nr:NAD+ synthase [bacterium]
MLCLIHQGNPIVAAVRHNLDRLKASIELAAQNNARLVITPELALIGYPPRDLLAYPELYKAEQRAMTELAQVSKEKKLAVLVGHIEKVPCIESNYFYNCATLFDHGKKVGTIRKQRLPNYDVFEENRFFEAWSKEQEPLFLDGKRLGIFICEDAWDDTPAFGVHDIKYHSEASSPWPQLKDCDLLINLSASPYSTKKRLRRQELFSQKARELQTPLLYSNCVGAQDDILFDGGSFACSKNGEIIKQAKLFETDTLLVNPLEDNTGTPNVIEYCHWKELSQALTMGLKDYGKKNNLSKAVLGLSGGIDSALAACIAAKALGPENILGVSLPTNITSTQSKQLAKSVAEALKIEFLEVNIAPSVERLSSDFCIPVTEMAYENLQARIRGTYLMSQANLRNSLLIATCNKSEAAMGYTTLYGDMCGTLAPLADLYKTEVYALAYYFKYVEKVNLPYELLLRAPTAELREQQLDTDSLPPYAVLDVALRDLIENQGLQFFAGEFDEFIEKYKLNKLFSRIMNFEFKRAQSGPVLKIHHRAFGSGWRMPLSKDLSQLDK